MEDYKSLSVEDLCSHKSWKARLEGYNQAKKIFTETEDFKSIQWNKFLGLMKSFVVDSNATCQESGLEAVLSFVEKSPSAGKVAGEVATCVVQKCIAAPKTRTRELAADVLLMYVEIGKQNAVIEELLEGTKSRNPKVRAASAHVLNQVVNEFGPSVVIIDKVLQEVPKLIEDKEKSVREESKRILTTLYRFIGENFRSKITKILKPNHLTKIEREYQNTKDDRLEPTRLLRSKQSRNFVESEKRSDVSSDSDEITKKTNEENHNFCEPVNILNKIKDDFYIQIESKKWVERKYALEEVEKLINASPKLENGEYGDLIQALKKIISKDANILVIIFAIKCLTGLSRGLGKHFKVYSSSVIPVLFEKFKEKKQNVVCALRESVDSVFSTTDLEALQDDILVSLDCKNPNIKVEVIALISRCFKKDPDSVLNKKTQKVFFKSLASGLRDQDPSVRENAAEALGTAMKLVGNQFMRPFLSDIDEVCIKKVTDYSAKCDVVSRQKEQKNTETKSAENVQEELEVKRRPIITKVKKIVNTEKCSLTRDKDRHELPPKSCRLKLKETVNENVQTQRVDIKSEISDPTIDELSHKNWNIRLEAVNKIQTTINTLRCIKGNLDGIDSLIAERILDNNSKVAECAIALVHSMVKAMGPASKRHVLVFLPALIRSMGDKKVAIKTAVISCLSTWSEICGLDKFIERGIFAEALKSGTPTAQAELWGWLADKLLQVPPKSIPEEGTCTLLHPLYAHLNCRHSEVKRRACDAARGIMIQIGYEKMISALANFSGSKSNLASIKEILNKVNYSLPLSPVNNKEIQNPQPKTIEEPQTSITKIARFSGDGEIAIDKESSSMFMLPNNNLKLQRIIDQERTKWDCRSTNVQVNEHLKNLMTSAKINSALIFEMFHSDFRFHIRAIETLVEELPLNTDGLKANLDLILHWIATKCFDSNPSVLLKGLEYLIIIFEALKNDKYSLFDSEAAILLPCLIFKFGDSKESVRSNIRQIMKLVAYKYPLNKQVGYFLKGIKSKYVRQRLECLEHLKWLIKEFKTPICCPAWTTELKGVAKLLEDRDAAVRAAALNCLCQIYLNEGEKPLKTIVQVPQKYLFLLEEKVRNLTKYDKPKELDISVIPHERPVAQEIRNVDTPFTIDGLTTPHEEESSPSNKIPKGPIKLDLGAHSRDYAFHAPKILDIDLGFLSDSPRLRSYNGKATHYIKSEETQDEIVETSEKNNSSLQEKEEIIKNISAELVKLLKDLKQREIQDVGGYYDTTLSLFRKVFENRSSCSQILEDELYTLLEQLLGTLNESNLEGKDYRSDKSLFQRLNTLVFTLLENADKTSVVSALLNLVKAHQESPLIELVLRCLWKLNQTQEDWDKELDYKKIISLINAFLNTCPQEWWKALETNPSLKTVKCLLQTMVKIRGLEALKLAEKITNSPINSGMVHVLRKLSKELLKNERNIEYTNNTRIPPQDNIMNSDSLQNGSTNLRRFIHPKTDNSYITPLNQNKILKKKPSKIQEQWDALNSLREKLGLQRIETDRKIEKENNISLRSDIQEIEAIKTRLKKMQSIFSP